MTRGDSPCTAITLIRGNPPELERCLQSAFFCNEHIILHGEISDETRALAEQYQCRLIPQDARFLDAEGSIINYAEMRNQGMQAAVHPWILMIDADEYLDDELVSNMQEKTSSGSPGAFSVNRLYVFDDRVIKAASSYPNRQIRFFHKDTVEKFEKVVHERPVLRPGFESSLLIGTMLVPLDEIMSLKKKYQRYLTLEVQRDSGLGWAHWFRFSCNKKIRIALRLLRIILIRITHRPSNILPLRYEMLNIWYATRLMIMTCPLFNK